MGKNQTHKMMQRSRGGGEEGQAELPSDDQGADVTFHTPEWHAARIAALTTERMSWEEWKKMQKEAAAKQNATEEEEEEQMRAYRAQLDADRNKKLAKGTNNAHLRALVKDMKSKKRKKDKKDKDKKRKKEGKKEKKGKKEKHAKEKKRRRDSSSSSSDSESGDSDAEGGPVRLSEFLQK